MSTADQLLMNRLVAAGHNPHALSVELAIGLADPRTSDHANETALRLSTANAKLAQAVLSALAGIASAHVDMASEARGTDVQRWLDAVRDAMLSLETAESPSRSIRPNSESEPA